MVIGFATTARNHLCAVQATKLVFYQKSDWFLLLMWKPSDGSIRLVFFCEAILRSILDADGYNFCIFEKKLASFRHQRLIISEIRLHARKSFFFALLIQLISSAWACVTDWSWSSNPFPSKWPHLKGIKVWWKNDARRLGETEVILGLSFT